MTPGPCVAVIGMGIMGSRIAKRLVDSGMDVRVWNRTQAESRAVKGAKVATHPTAAVEDADIAITMLTDATSVAEVMGGRGGALKAMKGGAIWLQMTTVGVGGNELLADLAEWAGVTYVDAPVLGTRDAAEDGTLTVLASGPDDAIEACRTVLEAISIRVIPLGKAGRASALKLVLNGWLLTLTSGLADALALSESLGLEPDEFLGAISGTGIDLPYAHSKVPAMLGGEHPTSFPLRLALKDAMLVQDAAIEAGLDPKLIDIIALRFATALEAGHGDADMTAVYEVIRKR